MPEAIFDLARIEERRERNRTLLQCESCRRWVRELSAVRIDAERPGVVWMCARCHNAETMRNDVPRGG